MKKGMACALLALAIVAAAEPHVRTWIAEGVQGVLQPQEESSRNEAAPSFEAQLGGSTAADLMDVTLYFRFAGTDVLGAERVPLDIRREEMVARRIVQQLIDGPSISHEQLSCVFPQGTELISVSGEDTTAFVTLSSEFLGRPDGAPADWEDLTAWQEEAALRRRLAVQSIALALTEDGRYQRVQLYVAENDDDIPQRIPLAWFDLSIQDMTTVLAATTRDEAAMLTPRRAMEMILDAWRMRDWAALYPMMAPDQAGEMPALSVFETQMNELGIMLLDSATTEGTVSFDGRRATMVLDARIRSADGGDAQIVRESVPLVRTDDNWTITMETLRSLMIRD